MSESKPAATVLVGTSIGADKLYCLPFLLPVLRTLQGVGAVHIVFDEVEPPADFVAQLKEGETFEVLPKLDGDFGYGARCGRVREKLREKFLAGKYPHLYFHDADMIPPADIIPRLKAHNVAATTGLYSMRSAQSVAIPGAASFDGIDSPFMVTREPDKKQERLRDLYPSVHFGMGCMLLSASALATPFRDPAWLETAGISEDIAWGRDFSGKSNLPAIWLDMSVSCWHVGDDGRASRIGVGDIQSGAIWTGQPHFVSNMFGEWERGMPRPLARSKAEQLSAEFLVGDYPLLSLEFAPLADIVPKGA